MNRQIHSITRNRFVCPYCSWEKSFGEKIFRRIFINTNINFESEKTFSWSNRKRYDYYLSDYDLYIEIQGNWTHGKHPFNKNDKDDLNIVELWKSKKSNYYNKAINDWTQKDPLKRETAKNNNLNYLEIFSNDIEIVIKTFEEYLLK